MKLKIVAEADFDIKEWGFMVGTGFINYYFSICLWFLPFYFRLTFYLVGEDE